MNRAWSLVLACGLSVLVRGAEAADDDGARDAMRRGIAAFARGETEAALSEYESAMRLAPAANAPHRYAAEALRSLGGGEKSCNTSSNTSQRTRM